MQSLRVRVAMVMGAAVPLWLMAHCEDRQYDTIGADAAADATAKDAPAYGGPSSTSSYRTRR
jgi:hypothetical protein